MGQLMTGVKRLVNKITDHGKNEHIKVFLNRHWEHTPYGIRSDISKTMLKNINDFSSLEDATVGVLTVNCAGNAPPTDQDFSGIILPDQWKP